MFIPNLGDGIDNQNKNYDIYIGILRSRIEVLMVSRNTEFRTRSDRMEFENHHLVFFKLHILDSFFPKFIQPYQIDRTFITFH